MHTGVVPREAGGDDLDDRARYDVYYSEDGDEEDRRGRLRSLMARPSREERSVTEEMRWGRRPDDLTPPGRALADGSGTHKKILVHGYCCTPGVFPKDAFADSLTFSDPDQTPSRGRETEPRSWSIDAFARKIDKFATLNGVDGCACVAHSQGGMACLHLYTYYWSCLNKARPEEEGGRSRLIQTVGTPYLGTNLADMVAVLGKLFGIGCGRNIDLTYSGASRWLDGIPYAARSEVTYFTTSFSKKAWWKWSFCHVGTDLFLRDPDDGTTEKYSGQLPGAHNGGHTEGWCHIQNMGDPAQVFDAARNAQMDRNARY